MRQRRRGRMENSTVMEKEELVGRESEVAAEEVVSGMGVICKHPIAAVTGKTQMVETTKEGSIEYISRSKIGQMVETQKQTSVYWEDSKQVLTEFNTIPDEIREDEVAKEKNPNGKVDARTEVIYLGNIFAAQEDNVTTKKLSNHDIPIGEEHQHLKNGVVESGLNSQRIVQHGYEIEESKQLRPGKSHKLEDTEFDVERVLEEQETHELYCPNCNECITKRVILRKIKRIEPSPARLSDVPSDKTTEVRHEDETVRHEDETAFRCLSCFSIFIPRDGGFNIFRFFRRREGSTNVQNSDQVPSIFSPGGTKNEGTKDGDHLKKPDVMIEPSLPGENFQTNQNVSDPVLPSTFVKPFGNDIIIPKSQIEQSSQYNHGLEPAAAVEVLIVVGNQSVLEPQRNNDWDVLKSIVYGGLIESITSLSVVSSAAGTDTSTLNICAMGIANLVGGLFVIVHALFELRSNPKPEATTDLRGEPDDRYRELLGRRDNFRRHIVLSILSYIIFGLLPPVIYGLSFRKSDNEEYKLIAVAVASLFSIALLGIGKAHVKPQKDYIKCLSYYIMLGVSASGLSYVAGVLIDKLLVELGVFDQNAPPSSSIGFRGIGSGASAQTSR